MRIIKIVATRCQISRLKCTKFNFGRGSAPDPAGSLQRSPNPLARFKGPTCKGRREERREWREGRGPLYFVLWIYTHEDRKPVSTLCLKKVPTFKLCNFVKSKPIFKICTLLESVRNLLQNSYHIIPSPWACCYTTLGN